MEAVAAIGLICNVVQLLDYGRKIVRELRQMRSGPGGFGGSDQGAHEAWLRTLMFVIKDMEASQTPHANSVAKSGDGELKALCNLAQVKAEELADVLATMRPPSGCSTARKVGIAVLSVSQQAKIKALSKDLGDLYSEASAFYHMRIGQENAAQLAQQSDRMSALVGVAERNALIAEKSRRIAESTRQDVRTLVWQMSQLPKECGYEWEHDPVVYVDDGLTAPFSVPIRFCHNKTGFITALSSMFMSRNLPGRRQFAFKHVDIMDSAFSAVDEGNWAVSVQPGRKLLLSFVMSSLLGLPKSKCPRCRKPYNAGSRPSGDWSQCTSCRLEARRALPDDYAYEPQDVTFEFDPNTYRDYKLRQKEQAASKAPKAPPIPEDSGAQPAYANSSPAQSHSDKINGEPSIELVCRRITLKWEPIFNIVHRYLMCRCVLRLSTLSRSRFDPEWVFCLEAVCPRHNNKGISFRDYGELVNNHEDPYFEPFGGYDCFRAVLAQDPEKYNRLGSDAFLTSDEWRRGMEKLALMLETCPEELSSAWEAYNSDVLDHIRPRRPERLGFSLPDDSGKQLSESAMIKEIGRILEGKWDGRPHWV